MKKTGIIVMIVTCVLISVQSRAEFHVYDGSHDFVGILVDTYVDSSDDRQWILYVPRTKLYFRYTLTFFSDADIRMGKLYYKTNNCTGTAYVPCDYSQFNTVIKIENADLFYTGDGVGQYSSYKSYWDGVSCSSCSNTAYFREAISVPSGNVPLVSGSTLQWKIEYRRSGVAVIPLFD